jgi:hypothetical protein
MSLLPHLKEASIRQLAASWSVVVMTVSNLVNQKTWSTFGFAEQLAQGNTDYIDPATASQAEAEAETDTTETTDPPETNDAGHTDPSKTCRVALSSVHGELPGR